VTLTGPGGTGKTRLATQAAHEVADALTDGVYFVDLSNLRDPALVPSEIAEALDIEEQGLEQHLRERRLLLVLDNLETVDEAAPLVSGLLTAAPELAVLATSRTPFGSPASTSTASQRCRCATRRNS
jgi:predicted ATPase